MKVEKDFVAEVKDEQFGTAHETFTHLRSKCPVAHSDDFNGFWVLTKYEDIQAVLKDPATYVTSVQNVVPKVSTTGRRPPLHLDPPEHTPYRRTLDPFFTDEKMNAIRPKVRAITERLLLPFIEKGGGDICAEYSHLLPGYVFAEFFNLSPEMSLEIRDVTSQYVSALHEQNAPMIQHYSLKLYEFAQKIIDDRKENPQNVEIDVVSAYLAKEHKGEKLPDEMILGTIRQLIVVGMIAPVIFIGSVSVHLATHKEIQQQLRNDLTLVPEATEEYLRLFTPYRGFARTPREDVEIKGRIIKKDEPIALAFGSGNRDEDIFPNGDQFILNRSNIKEHLAFGMGPHRCPGSPLARIMFQETLEVFLSNTTSIDLQGEVKMTNWPEWGASYVPLKIKGGK